jgi:N-acetylmuramoyl-L-alanine amidase
LVFRAAELRERLFRIEHRDVDALEAAELFASVARARSENACAAVVRGTLIDAELKAEPALAYRKLYAERARSESGADSACRALIDRALLGLAGQKPSRETLSEIETAARGSSERPEPSSAPASVAPATVVVPSVSAVPAGPAEITSIERYGAEDAARVVVHVTRPARFDMSFVDAKGTDPYRVVLDLPGVSYRGKTRFPVGGLVSAVRIGDQRTATRIVLDLRESAHRRAFYLPEPFRLVVDVSKEPQPSLARGAGPRSVRRVVLDPGHGGHDPGATGPSGLREKDVTLDIAHRAAPLVARELGIVTLLTRDTDVFVPLDERTARANAFGADLLVSIHCNANEDGNGRGVATFVLDDSSDQAASRIAARENAASVEAAVELANTLSRVLDRGTAERSAEFAGLLQRATMASLGQRYAGAQDLGVRRAGFYVLAGARMPAVLFETSFISSAVEETRLNTPDYRQKLADAVVNAIRAYREGR